jgi:Gpi18-like mannosyltransferase
MIKDKGVKQVILFSLIIILSTFFIAILAYIFQANSFVFDLTVFNRWDSVHYLQIADTGYELLGNNIKNIVFFPLYPLIIKIVNYLINNYILSSLIIANIFYILTMIIFYYLLLIDYSAKFAFKVIVFLSLFPTAYFFHFAYSESLFIFLVIASFYSARKQKWWLAGIWGFCAGLTRISGFLLFFALMFEYWQQKKFKIKNFTFNFFSLFLIPLAGLVYLFINFSLYKNPFVFLYYQKNFWYKTIDYPWNGFVGSLTSFMNREPAEAILVSGYEVFFSCLGLILIIYSFNKIRYAYSIYAIFSWFLIVSTSFLLSTPRYLLSIFPIFMGLVLLMEQLKNKQLVQLTLYYLFIGLQVLFISNFIMGRWAF